jgi:anti-sigma factor NepR-like protein
MRSKSSPQHKISEQIGKELRAIYDGVLQEPIPDRFLALVDRLGEEMATGPASRPSVRSLPRGVTRLERV